MLKFNILHFKKWFQSILIFAYRVCEYKPNLEWRFVNDRISTLFLFISINLCFYRPCTRTSTESWVTHRLWSNLNIVFIHFNQFMFLQTVYANINRILSDASSLIESQHYASPHLRSVASRLDKAWKDFATGLDERTTVLALSVLFHQKAEQVNLNFGSLKLGQYIFMHFYIPQARPKTKF